ncbi:thermonuclease family protein [Thermoflavimicrobium dichotomicum]|uniref:Micrococcal nuclease n=1 Tax=Thermoflavimicrobium dichotomicum TaxID=46223 RepID=A0A1I3TB53_9BACL|nr:thermonuclease family protein [Thermoflavimicrobium dichotomicum]SFJ66906.1 micrococcal nuclease [Thermoflavimicrobium dichotomicum]
MMREKVKVLRVVDGDTLEVEVAGRKEHVRLLYIDCPELHSEDVFERKKALEAKRYVIEQIKNSQEVILSTRKRFRNRDRYGRLVVDIYLDGKLLQAMLVRQGLACLRYFGRDLSPGIMDRINFLLRLENQARARKKGVWKRSLA